MNVGVAEPVQERRKSTLATPSDIAIDVKEAAVASTAAPAKKKSSPRLNQLTGMRAFASLWIVSGHYSPKPEYPFGRILSRAWVGVSFFVFLSGFITHYAYFNKTYTEWANIRQFYFRRIGRVVASYYVSYAVVAIGYLAVNGVEEDAHQDRGWYMYVLDALMMTTLNPWDSSPRFNHAAWTICSLLFAWLCYPFIQAWLKRVEPPSWAILLGAFCMYIMELAAALLAAFYGSTGEHDHPVYWGERFPGTVILQFAVGMCFAHLLRRKHFLEWKYWALVGDVVMLTSIVLLLIISNPAGPLAPCRCEREAFFAQGMTPFFALYIYASSCSILTRTRQGYFSQLLTHNVTVGIGDFSFQVYLWQGPIANLMCGIIILFEIEESTCSEGSPSFPGPFFGAFMLVLYLFSGSFAYKIEAPFIGWLTRVTDLQPKQNRGPAAKVEREDQPMIKQVEAPITLGEDIKTIFEEALQTRGRRISFEQDAVQGLQMSTIKAYDKD